MTVEVSPLAYWSMRSDRNEALGANRLQISTLTGLLEE